VKVEQFVVDLAVIREVKRNRRREDDIRVAVGILFMIACEYYTLCTDGLCLTWTVRKQSRL
jgi:hypothetical protein